MTLASGWVAIVKPERDWRERLAGALELFEKLKAPFGRARAYLGLAHSATAAGHAERVRSMLEFARQQLDEAEEIAVRTGQGLLVERVRRER